MPSAPYSTLRRILHLRLDDGQRMANLRHCVIYRLRSRTSPLRTGQRSQAEIRDRLRHRIGAHVTFRVEPPGAPVAHPDDRECGNVSIHRVEPTDIDAALD